MANEWFVECPNCNVNVVLQTPYVTKYVDPKFECKSCDAKGLLVAYPGIAPELFRKVGK
jgi:hypothetical protein